MTDKILNLTNEVVPDYLLKNDVEVLDIGVIVEIKKGKNGFLFNKLVMQLLAEYDCKAAYTSTGLVVLTPEQS